MLSPVTRCMSTSDRDWFREDHSAEVDVIHVIHCQCHTETGAKVSVHVLVLFLACQRSKHEKIILVQAFVIPCSCYWHNNACVQLKHHYCSCYTASCIINIQWKLPICFWLAMCLVDVHVYNLEDLLSKIKDIYLVSHDDVLYTLVFIQEKSYRPTLFYIGPYQLQATWGKVLW